MFLKNFVLHAESGSSVSHKMSDSDPAGTVQKLLLNFYVYEFCFSLEVG